VVGVSTAVNALAWGVILGVALALTGQVTSLGQYYLVQAGGGLGGAIGPFLGGWLFDVTGSYRLAFMAACVAVAGSAVASWFAARPMPGTPDGYDDAVSSSRARSASRLSRLRKTVATAATRPPTR
jgi:MFS family permease